MEIGRAKIVVPMPLVGMRMLMGGMLMMVIMIRMGRPMMIIISKKPGTDQVDRQAYDRHDNGLVEIDGDRGGNGSSRSRGVQGVNCSTGCSPNARESIRMRCCEPCSVG